MHRVLAIVLYFTLSTLSANAQKTSTQPPKFDIANFEKHQTDGGYVFILNNGDHVQQVGDKKMGYVERLEKKASPYGYYKEFFPNGELKTGGPTFYGRMIGIHEKYNEHGILVDSENLDKGFTFTIDNLVEEVDSIYHVNLLNIFLGCNVVRNTDGPIPLYFVSIRLEGKDTRDIEINGINGRVISNTITKRAIKATE